MSTSPHHTSDPAHDVLRDARAPLNAFFNPKTVAVIGATDKANSAGRTALWNLVSHPFGGMVFPINPHRTSVLGIKTYPTAAAVPEPIDLAVIATPAATVPKIVSECADIGVKGAIILSAGFRETGPEGTERENQILAEARRGKLRIIGPNCLGVISPLSGLNASFASPSAVAGGALLSPMPRPGSVAFISQSGALCTAILDWSFRQNVGFSAFVSIGSMLDVGWGDLIDFLGDDPRTKSIVVYMESIGDAGAFLSAAREVALTKPIILIKAGRTAAGARAAASHTGALCGSDEVLDAALRRCGVLRVYHLAHLFYMAELLGKQPRPRGPRLTVVTNAGGPGVLATDTLIAEGGQLAKLAPESLDKLKKVLPMAWSHGNPVDILGDATPERYTAALQIVAEDANSDGILLMLTPQAMSEPMHTAELIKKCVAQGLPEKPILASWMGGDEVQAGANILNQANIPTFPYPDTAVRLFNYMWQYSCNLDSLYETPSLPGADTGNAPDRGAVRRIIEAARRASRTLLTEFESKQLIAAYGIPTVATHAAMTVDEAVSVAEEMGYPVVLKLLSHTITHKSDVGGVQLNLNDAAAVQKAYCRIQREVSERYSAQDFHGVTVQPMLKLDGYELIVGSSLDSQFGPVLLFGTGGKLVEVFRDQALGLPPLTTTLARRMIERTKIYSALKGIRGQNAIDLDALEKLLVSFSQLVVEQPWIKEIEINPLLVDSNGMIALDARALLHSADVNWSQIPKLAIRPYPTQYSSVWTTKKSGKVTIRPIRPEDEPLAVRFHEGLSEESVYLRYAHRFKLSQRIAHDRLSRLCFIDYDREIALVADYKDPGMGNHEIVGIARLSRRHDGDKAEFSLIITDRFQCQGLGSELLRRLVVVARAEKLGVIFAEIWAINHAMQRIAARLGFQQRRILDEPMVRVWLDLTKSAQRCPAARTRETTAADVNH
ncbi:MAG: bifunctional acetate--CoA ligase family protein/GNAT family N-acetyltransferase [Gammaproteobacteria bacterium]